MDHNLAGNESMAARIKQLEHEHDQLHKDIEQLCMQQAGPAYLGVATQMHFQRTAGLEQEIENLKKKLATCARENQNLQEELSEAYHIKSQLAELHSMEVSKNIEAEKQLKFFQGCVAAAFAERDNAIMEAEKSKEKEELVSQEQDKLKIRIEELTFELSNEKRLATTLRVDLENQERQNETFREVINKFYDIRQQSIKNFSDTSWEDKCESLLNDSTEMWNFQSDDEPSISNYISDLEAEVKTLRNSMDNLQNKLQLGLEIETHLKRKVYELEKEKIASEKKIKKEISALLNYHSQFRSIVTTLLDEGYSDLKSVIINMVEEKIRELEVSAEQNLKSSLPEDIQLNGSDLRDDTSIDSVPDSMTKRSDRGISATITMGTGDTSEALGQALEEKVSALLLLSQEEERHMLERNLNASLQKKVEELQRNLLQVTNEKVKALLELAQLKQKHHILQEKISQEMEKGKHLTEIEERTLQEKDGRLKNLLKKTYLRNWVVGVDGSHAEAHANHEGNVTGRKSIHSMDFARMKIENATLKESLESMEHLTTSIHRLRISLLKVKESASAKGANINLLEAADQIVTEAKLIKTALSSSLPISQSVDADGSYGGSSEKLDDISTKPGDQKIDFVSAAGFEMMELLIFAAHELKDSISNKDLKNSG